MAFGATLAGVMIAGLDLLEPARTRRAGFVAAQAMAERQLGQLDIGIVDVSLAGAVATLAGERLVLCFRQLLDVIRMALVTGLAPGESHRTTGQFPKGVRSIPPELSERRRGEKRPGREV